MYLISVALRNAQCMCCYFSNCINYECHTSKIKRQDSHCIAKDVMYSQEKKTKKGNDLRIEK